MFHPILDFTVLQGSRAKDKRTCFMPFLFMSIRMVWDDKELELGRVSDSKRLVIRGSWT